MEMSISGANSENAQKRLIGLSLKPPMESFCAACKVESRSSCFNRQDLGIVLKNSALKYSE